MAWKIKSLSALAIAAFALSACAAQSGLDGVASSQSAGMKLDKATQTATSAVMVDLSARAHAGWISADAGRHKKLVYVSDQYDNAVEIYKANVSNPPPIGQITSGVNTPDGLAVDTSGNLYVSNAGGTTVTVYHPGQTTPFDTYSPGQNPVNVVLGKDGRLYVAQGLLGCICITEYPPKSHTPDLTIQLSQTHGSPMDLALDASNDLYVTLTNGTVYEFAPGQTSGTNLGLAGLSNPRGIGFDKKGDLVVANDTLNFVQGYIQIYDAGKTQYEKQFIAGAQPFQLAFGRGRRYMYVADVSYGTSGDVAIFKAGNGWAQTGAISQGLHQPLGVALSPKAL
ncbi:MAG: SMP-30/gluconolactonase/LRE family protein [Candidatus Eremiobacteraeota bacterium]|nr:SMP-30/gluconolactonase/LRE family protein [Candidatus Eremiobacteraeota bacterium]